jgi:hypothetical protein
MKAWGRPLIGTLGGGVVDEKDVNALVNTCESAEEREHMTRRTDTCILRVY